MAERIWTPESIHEMATTAKECVSSASRWMTSLQALPIEAAEADYLSSPYEGDEMLKQLQEHIEQSPARGVGKPFIHERWLDGSPVSILLDEAWGLQSAAFTSLGIEFQPAERSVLTNCAHSAEFRLIAGSQKFQTGFEAADFFAGQIDKYFAYIWQIDVERAETFADIITMSRGERIFARQVLEPCVCVEQLQRVIDYETAWLLHSFCGMPQPQRWALPTPIQLLDTSPVIAAAHVIKSKPLRFGSWFQRFKAAKYSENESERAFRDWLKSQLGKTAFRDTRNGPICFDVAFLQQHGVKDSE